MTGNATSQELVDQLAALLQVTPLEGDVFEGARTPAGAENGVGRVYGGQVIAQALAAAEATAPEGRPPHSLHAYFLRMGDEAEPIHYEVSRDLDGGSFTNRRVAARQGERLLLSLTASFQRREDGAHHQDAMPDAPDPETLPTDIERRQSMLHRLPEHRRGPLSRQRPIEMRSVEETNLIDPKPSEPHVRTWMRAIAPVGDDLRLHRTMLAYASDMALIPTATRAHGLSGIRGDILEASLDHSIWFHDDFRIDDWLLYETRSHWTGRGRGLISGRVFRRDGALVASVSQEGMIRLVKRD